MVAFEMCLVPKGRHDVATGASPWAQSTAENLALKGRKVELFLLILILILTDSNDKTTKNR